MAVAVDESKTSSNDDVYVADSLASRVQKFDSIGDFILAFGWDVNETKDKKAGATQAEKNVCTAASGDVCTAGVGGSSAGQFDGPGAVAVDPATGDVYVTDKSNHRVDKYDSSGDFILTFGWEVNETKDREAGATRAEKNVCTAASGDVCTAGATGSADGQFEPWPLGNLITVGKDGIVYVGDEARVQKFEPSGKWKGPDLSLSALSATGKVTALAIGPGGGLYLTDQGVPGVRRFEPAGVSYKESATRFDAGSTSISAMAYEPFEDDVVVVDSSSPGLRVLQYTSTGALAAESETKRLREESHGVAANASGTIYAATEESEQGEEKGIALFGMLPQQGNPAPSIDAESLSDLDETGATVTAQVNPHFLATGYRVQYVSASDYQPSASDPYVAGGEVPTHGEIALGGGLINGDQQASAILTGLSPGTTYHFRFVATSRSGTTFGADDTFTTYSPSALSGLPDERIYEQVSEAEKNGTPAGIFPEGAPLAGYAAASANGDRLLYFQKGPSGETRSGADLYSVATRRSDAGWSSAAALPPGYGLNSSNFLGEEPKILIPSTDSSRFVFETTGVFGAGNFGEGDTGAGSLPALYRTAAGAAEPEWWLSKPTIANPAPNPFGPLGSAFSGSRQIPAGGSPTLDTFYFTYFGTLIPEDSPRAAHVEADEAGPWGFYEWHDGTLRSAAPLPESPGEPEPGRPDQWGALPAATLQARNEVAPSPDALANQVSQDGTRAFFVSPEPRQALTAGTPTELYVREQTPTGARTVLVSRDDLKSGEPAQGAGSETAVTPIGGSLNGPYLYASPDGSRAFFASRDRLTEDAPADGAVKEYEFDLETERLSYLPGFTEPASAPFSRILASSASGDTLIFENPETRKVELWRGPAGGAEAVSEVASFPTMSSATFTARANADGSTFVFETDAVITRCEALLTPGGCNNSAGMRQVYRYTPGASEVSCLSCAPAGVAQSPAGTFGEAGTARVIADEGSRVFFATAAKLVSRAVNGVEDVYEWEAAGAGSCPPGAAAGCIYLISTGTGSEPSFYLDSDESGENVFFATSQGLVAADTDGAYDVYDARVGGGFPQPPRAAECESECQGPPTPFSPAPPLTALAGPSGNLAPPVEAKQPTQLKPKLKPLTRAQKLARSLKACAKQPKRKRAACVRQAERRYGARKTGHARRARRTS